MAAVGTLTIEMAANVARLQRDMERATKTVGGAMDRIQKSVQMATRAMGALTAAFAAYKTIQGIIQQADAMTLLNSRLQLVTKSQQEFIRTQEALVSISQRSYTGLSSTVDLYTSLSRATANLGFSQNELLRVVETFNKSIIISGGSVQAADAAITQFNQAMASGVLRGEEFNSISEQAPMIMELLANSLGVTRGALRDMAKEGLLVAELVLPALLEGSKSVDDQFTKLNKTIGQSGVQFKNQFALLIDQLNKLTGGTEGASRGLDGFTFNLKILTDLLRAINGPAQAFNETQAETERLLRQNEQAAKANNEAVRSTAKAILEKKKADELAKKAAEELQKAYEKLIETLREDIRGSTAALQAEQQGLNKAQESYLVLVSSPEWKNYTEAQRMLITDLYKQRIETEQLIDLEKKRAKAAEDRLKKMLDDEKEFRAELKKEDEKLAAEKLKKEEEFFAQQRKQIQQIEDQLTDALMRAFESGKGFGQAFKDTLVNMFRTMVLRPVLAPIVGGLVGGASGSAMAGTGTMDLISGATQMYSIVTTGFAKVGATVSLALQNAGDYLATSSIDAVAAGGEFLQTIAQGAGPIASSIAGAATGMFLNSMISGGYSMGKGMDTFQKIGITVASFVGGPVLGAIVGAATGVFNRLFGRKLQDVGIEGTFGDSGFEGQSYKFYKGGLFRSDKTKRSPLDEELESFLGDSFLAIRGATAAMAVALGQSADSIFAFTKDIKLSFKGLKEEQIQALLTEQFELLGDELAQLALGTEEFTKKGESASETLQRLYESVINVNSVFETLRLTMYDFTLISADMASQLVDLFGGIENFVDATTAYYESFYREAERTSILTRQLTFSFGQLGLALPETRDAFRKVVEAQDLTTESGRQMFAALVQLSPAFASITKSAEETFSVLQQNTDKAFASLQKAIEAQRRSIELSKQAATEQLSALKNVFDVLTSGIEDLIGQGMSAASGRAFIDQAIATARATGYLPDANDLQRAINAAIGGTGSSGYASAFEMNRDRALLASRLTTLRDLTDEQLTEVERQVQLLEDQLTALDDQLSLAQKQLDALRGIDNSILSLADAMALFASAMGREGSAALTNAARSYSGGVVVGSAGSQSGMAATEARTPFQESLFNLYDQVLGRAPDIGGMDFYETSGKSLEQIAAEIKDSPEAQVRNSQGVEAQNTFNELVNEQLGFSTNIKARAAGGFARGLTLVGENGPELVNFADPGMVYSASQSRSMMADTSVTQELTDLRNENKVQLRAMVSLQNRMTKIVEQWNNDGLPTERVEA
jgi:tape measure domain-containing protein